jgi:colanic acid/amylovoran biosynthesis glycosyltransferase
MNWLYDHLRAVPRYTPLVLCDRLAHRDEFPELNAWPLPHERLDCRAWHRLMGDRLYPPLGWRLRRTRPRLLHTHFGYVAETDLALQRALEVPWLIGFYGADVYELGREQEWQDRYVPVFGQATRVLALGPAMAAALRHLGCPEHKLVVHTLGVDTRSLPHQARTLADGDPLRILFAGTFREKKGIEYLIHAAHLAHSGGVRLELHLAGDAHAKPGDAETKAEVFRLIGCYGLEDFVVQHSWLPFQELLTLALRCHLFVAPSVTARNGDSEGTPFVVQQMMATAMPVISTVHSDIPFVFGAHASQLVPERDARAIADRIQAYADEPERLTRDGRALAAQMRANFDVRDRAAALADLYDSVS